MPCQNAVDNKTSATYYANIYMVCCIQTILIQYRYIHRYHHFTLYVSYIQYVSKFNVHEKDSDKEDLL